MPVNAPSIDEKQLIRRLQVGDEMAFEILFYRYRGKVGNFLRKSLPAHADLEETVHEIFLRTWINKERLDSDRPLEPYLFRIAKNMVIDALRRKVEQSVYLYEGTFFSDIGRDGADSLIREKELQNWLDMTLKKLPKRRRKIFEMNRFADLTYREIASQLDISENTVDTQIRRALQFLKGEIKKLMLFFF